MRMRNGDRGNSPKRVDETDRVRIDKAYAVPEDIAVGGSNQQRPLSNGKSGHRLDAPNSFAFLKQCVPVCLLQFLERGPLLSL